jgi:hypothetical protein
MGSSVLAYQQATLAPLMPIKSQEGSIPSDEADEAFAGTVPRMEAPAHARAG